MKQQLQAKLHPNIGKSLQVMRLTRITYWLTNWPYINTVLTYFLVSDKNRLQVMSLTIHLTHFVPLAQKAGGLTF